MAMLLTTTVLDVEFEPEHSLPNKSTVSYIDFIQQLLMVNGHLFTFIQSTLQLMQLIYPFHTHTHTHTHTHNGN